MEGNVYVLEKEETVTKNADISAFFLETSIQEAMKAGEGPIHVPVLQYICLYKDRIVRYVPNAPFLAQHPFLRLLQPFHPTAGVSLPFLQHVPPLLLPHS